MFDYASAIQRSSNQAISSSSGVGGIHDILSNNGENANRAAERAHNNASLQIRLVNAIKDRVLSIGRIVEDDSSLIRKNKNMPIGYSVHPNPRAPFSVIEDRAMRQIVTDTVSWHDIADADERLVEHEKMIFESIHSASRDILSANGMDYFINKGGNTSILLSHIRQQLERQLKERFKGNGMPTKETISKDAIHVLELNFIHYRRMELRQQMNKVMMSIKTRMNIIRNEILESADKEKAKIREKTYSNLITYLTELYNARNGSRFNLIETHKIEKSHFGTADDAGNVNNLKDMPDMEAVLNPVDSSVIPYGELLHGIGMNGRYIGTPTDMSERLTGNTCIDTSEQHVSQHEFEKEMLQIIHNERVDGLGKAYAFDKSLFISGKLRPFQKMIQLVLHPALGYKGVMCMAGVGSGKTLAGLALIMTWFNILIHPEVKQAYAPGKQKVNVLVLAPSLAIADGWIQEIKSLNIVHFDATRNMKVSGDIKNGGDPQRPPILSFFDDEGNEIISVMLKRLDVNLDKAETIEWDLIIVDECDKLNSNVNDLYLRNSTNTNRPRMVENLVKCKLLLQRSTAKVLLLGATPIRSPDSIFDLIELLKCVAHPKNQRFQYFLDNYASNPKVFKENVLSMISEDIKNKNDFHQRRLAMFFAGLTTFFSMEGYVSQFPRIASPYMVASRLGLLKDPRAMRFGVCAWAVSATRPYLALPTSIGLEDDQLMQLRDLQLKSLRKTDLGHFIPVEFRCELTLPAYKNILQHRKANQILDIVHEVKASLWAYTFGDSFTPPSTKMNCMVYNILRMPDTKHFCFIPIRGSFVIAILRHLKEYYKDIIEVVGLEKGDYQIDNILKRPLAFSQTGHPEIVRALQMARAKIIQRRNTLAMAGLLHKQKTDPWSSVNVPKENAALSARENYVKKSIRDRELYSKDILQQRAISNSTNLMKKNPNNKKNQNNKKGKNKNDPLGLSQLNALMNGMMMASSNDISSDMDLEQNNKYKDSEKKEQSENDEEDEIRRLGYSFHDPKSNDILDNEKRKQSHGSRAQSHIHEFDTVYSDQMDVMTGIPQDGTTVKVFDAIWRKGWHDDADATSTKEPSNKDWEFAEDLMKESLFSIFTLSDLRMISKKVGAPILRFIYAGRESGLSKVTKKGKEEALFVEDESKIKHFNLEANDFGAFFNVLVGSQETAEGINLRNISTIHHQAYTTLTNFTQANGRGFRSCSHGRSELDARKWLTQILMYTSFVNIPGGQTTQKTKALESTLRRENVLPESPPLDTSEQRVANVNEKLSKISDNLLKEGNAQNYSRVSKDKDASSNEKLQEVYTVTPGTAALAKDLSAPTFDPISETGNSSASASASASRGGMLSTSSAMTGSNKQMDSNYFGYNPSSMRGEDMSTDTMFKYVDSNQQGRERISSSMNQSPSHSLITGLPSPDVGSIIPSSSRPIRVSQAPAFPQPERIVRPILEPSNVFTPTENATSREIGNTRGEVQKRKKQELLNKQKLVQLKKKEDDEFNRQMQLESKRIQNEEEKRKRHELLRKQKQEDKEFHRQVELESKRIDKEKRENDEFNRQVELELKRIEKEEEEQMKAQQQQSKKKSNVRKKLVKKGNKDVQEKEEKEDEEFEKEINKEWKRIQMEEEDVKKAEKKEDVKKAEKKAEKKEDAKKAEKKETKKIVDLLTDDEDYDSEDDEDYQGSDQESSSDDDGIDDDIDDDIDESKENATKEKTVDGRKSTRKSKLDTVTTPNKKITNAQVEEMLSQMDIRPLTNDQRKKDALSLFENIRHYDALIPKSLEGISKKNTKILEPYKGMRLVDVLHDYMADENKFTNALAEFKPIWDAYMSTKPKR